MKNIPLLLMGCGGVGRQLLQHIVSCRSLHAQQGVCVRVVGVCDSKYLVVASDLHTMELDDTFLMEICQVKLNGSSLMTLSKFGDCQAFSDLECIRKITEIASILGRSTGLALVDCSASSETITVLNQAVDLGCCVVLANKKPLTSSMEDYDQLVSQPRRIRHESTVGAGLPVIASLNRMLSSGDPICRIIGSLSGTLGYVMSEVEDGKPLSHVVKAAKTLGYTEPDPRDDLGGMDVARKALILARLLGCRINLESIKIESLYPEEMGPNVMPVEDFLMSGLPLLDKDIQDRIQKASLNGNVLRYVCLIEASRACIDSYSYASDSDTCVKSAFKSSPKNLLWGDCEGVTMFWRFTAGVIMSNLWLFKVLELAMILQQPVSWLTFLIFRIYFLDKNFSRLIFMKPLIQLLGMSSIIVLRSCLMILSKEPTHTQTAQGTL